MSQKNSLYHLFKAPSLFLCVSIPSFDLKAEHKSLEERRIAYSGEAVSVRQQLEAALVIPAWPEVGAAAVCPIIDVIDEHLVDELADPRQALLPESEWPSVTPVSKVHALVSEWYEIVKAAHARKMFVEIAEDKIFRNQHGDLVLNGAMGVIKLKTINGKEVKLLDSYEF